MASKQKICKSCGTVAIPKKNTKGSIAIELTLWLFFLVPGLIYSLWRLSNRYEVCPNCGSEEIVPLDSSMGRKLQKETDQDV